MKFLKGFGGALCFIGCLAALMGILATAAPMMDNDQVRRILESFSVPTRDVVLQAINNFFLLCLQQNYWVFGAGIGVLLLGGLIRMYAERSLLADVVVDDRQPKQVFRSDSRFWYPALFQPLFRVVSYSPNDAWRFDDACFFPILIGVDTST